ncbi:protein kinase [Streptomyces sp. NPDC058625]|uniref:serine/threonine-protein kinase n=1 Tax=Streptomyces sp. NPDC058625 TaxID=3346564 RepID=UPI00366521D8
MVEGLRAGDRQAVGPYRLLRRLGAGGMGQVFLGRSRGGRLVAVKVVHPELATDAEFRRRFAREVEAARQVGGFYTAQVVDADPQADPPWLVTAYIDGPSLQEAVRRHGPLPTSALWRLAAGLAEGLAAVHACDMVHRDLKPANVLLAPDGPRLIDFGIARAADDTQLTRTGLVFGTPGFMAPEHVVGNQAGPEADVFALGGVLAFAASGVSPFGHGAAHAVNYRAVYEEPQLADGLPVGLRPLVVDCLAKAPDARPTVAEILERLPALDDAEGPWLPPEVTLVIGPGRDGKPGEGTSDNGAGGAPETGTDTDTDAGTGPTSAPGPGAQEPAMNPAAAEARRAERERRVRRVREQGRERAEARARRLLTRAEEVTSHISGGEERVRTLSSLAAAVYMIDRTHAKKLMRKVEQQTHRLPDPLARVRVMAAAARECAPLDRSWALSHAMRAEATARGINVIAGRKTRRKALYVAAEGLAPLDPARAEEIVRQLGNVPGRSDDAQALSVVARAMAAVDPDRAERMARSLPAKDVYFTEKILAKVAVAVAGDDADRAARLLQGIEDQRIRAKASKKLSATSPAAEATEPRPSSFPDAPAAPGAGPSKRQAVLDRIVAMAAADPDRALQSADALPDKEDRAVAQCEVVAVLVDTDLERAEQIALSITGGPASARARANAMVARELCWSAPGRAERLFHEVEQIIGDITDPKGLGEARTSLAVALVEREPVRARRVAAAITDPEQQAHALCLMADELADTAPELTAELIADLLRTTREITDPAARGIALEQAVRQLLRSTPLPEHEQPQPPQQERDQARGRRQGLPQRQLAAEVTVQAMGLHGPRRDIGLLAVANLLIDVVLEDATALAREALSIARSEHDGDKFNFWSEKPLTALALIDAREAARLAVEPPLTPTPDQALAKLAQSMVAAADRHFTSESL